MNYELAEQSIVDRLNAWFGQKGLDVFFVAAVMPDTEQDLKDFEKNFTKARVAVEYQDSNYKFSNGLGCVKQDESVRFRLLYEARKMRGQGGLFTMLLETKNALIGFRLPGSTNALTVAGSGKQFFETGIALPYLDIQCDTVNVQAWEEDEEVGGPFVGIGFPNEQFSNALSDEFK